jgi:DNA-binding XRE family transcriptional regulator
LHIVNKNSTFAHKKIYNLNIRMMNTVGTRIRKIREEHGIKQEIMASEMGITQSSYGRLEKDDNRLTAIKSIKKTDIKIATFLR